MDIPDPIPDLACRLLRAKYPAAAYAYLHGSACTGALGPGSDIDLVVVSGVPLAPARELFVFEERLFDVHVYDEESLNGALHVARSSGRFMLARALDEGRILPAPQAAAVQLQDIARRVLAGGFSKETQQFQRQFITNILDDLLDCEVPAERTMLYVELFRATTELMLLAGGAGTCTSKHAVRALRAIDGAACTRLDAALVQALAGAPDGLVRSAHAALEQFGGPLREGFRMPCPPAPRLALPIL